MSDSQRLYHTVLRAILPNCPTRRITQTRNLAWFITALYLAAHCRLSRLASRVPWSGLRDSRIQRLRRVLLNPRLDVRTLYGPTVGCLLQWLHRPGEPLLLVIDRTTHQDEMNLLMVGVAFRQRTLPLAWKVQKKFGAFQLRYIQAALRFVAQWAPPQAQIWVVGDREYQDVALQTFVRDTLGWHFVQRLDKGTWIHPVGQASFKLTPAVGRPGAWCAFDAVRITKQRFGPVALIVYWAVGEAEPWYLISDQAGGLELVGLYARRFWIEEMFRDFKSHGWDLEHSELTQPARIEKLLLLIALAYVWLVQLGVVVVKRGWRKWVDRTAARTLSYFRLGWDWLWRLLTLQKPLPEMQLGTVSIH